MTKTRDEIARYQSEVGPPLVIDSLPIRDVPSFEATQNVQVLTIMENPTRSLDFLDPLAERIRQLVVTNMDIRDVSTVAKFSDLRYLSLFIGKIRKNGGFDAQRLRLLKTYAFRWEEGIANVAELPSLTSLMVERPKPRLTDIIEGSPNLRNIDIRTAGKIESLTFPSGSELGDLSISKAKLPGGLHNIPSHGSFKRLTLQSVDKMPLSTFENLPSSLETIVLEDGGDMGEAQWLLNLDGLKKVLLIGNTRISSATASQLKEKIPEFTAPQVRNLLE
ncbi:hypothetical protein KIH74_35070 [Kineosporia sp. J2-2]|uniref:Leucine-rich repeat domain-containing protein n=1 Tax=Kineosporia corallincola TaxID=2835133 RepID=A0ABS5TTZ9_9ACTN|nr:hypothetical protein [Kineosporia corallincola]MBT0774219.1 hypothetical protein [Kineosporia corallincola]